MVPTWLGLRDKVDGLTKKHVDCDRVVARARGRLALAPQQVSVVLLTDDINRELDRLEGDLRMVFPWATGHVSAYLRSPTGYARAPAEGAWEISPSQRTNCCTITPS